MDLDILLELTIGQLRELIAYEDADKNLEEFWDNCVDEDDLERIGYDPYSDDEEEDEDEYFLDDDYEEEDYEDEEEDFEDELDDCECGALENPEEEELAQSIAADINAGRYTYDVVYGVYPEHIVKRIEELA